MGLKMKSPHLEESFLKEKISWIEEKRLEYLTGGEGLFSVFGKALMKAWQWEMES